MLLHILSISYVLVPYINLVQACVFSSLCLGPFEYVILCVYNYLLLVY